MNNKIAIIGAGNVGSTIAYTLMLNNTVSELLLVDIDTKKCQGQVDDLADALAFSRTTFIRQGNFNDAGQADIAIISAGLCQKPGQSRLELAAANAKIVRSIIEQMKPLRDDLVIIIVTNPVDIMTYVAQQTTNLPRNQLFGSGTFLDTQRLRGYLAQELTIAEQSIHAYVLGEHGDSQFVAWSGATIAGIPLNEFKQIQNKLVELEKKTATKVYDIIECKGSTYFGIAACVSALCTTILFNEHRVAPVSWYQEKFNVCLSLPAIMGKKGIEEILKIQLDEQEQEKLALSAENLRNIIKRL